MRDARCLLASAGDQQTCAAWVLAGCMGLVGHEESCLACQPVPCLCDHAGAAGRAQGPRHRQSRRMHWHEGAPLCSIKRPRNGGAKRPPKRGNGTRSLLILVGRCAHMALAVSMEVRVDFACCEAPLSRTRPGPVPDLTQVSHGGTITCRVGDRLSGCTPSRRRRSATS